MADPCCIFIVRAYNSVRGENINILFTINVVIIFVLVCLFRIGYLPYYAVFPIIVILLSFFIMPSLLKWLRFIFILLIALIIVAFNKILSLFLSPIKRLLSK